MAELKTLYRRHVAGCPGKKHGRKYTKCNCPIHCDGRINGKRVHHTMKTRDWSRAEYALAHEGGAAATGGQEPPPAARMPLEEAITAYLADAKRLKQEPSGITSKRATLRALLTFAASLKWLDLITASVLRTFCGERSHLKAGSQRKEIKALRAFFAFCVSEGWLTVNPAKTLALPKEDREPTLPFEPREIDKILEAIETPRQRALILTLLYTGLRISDVAVLERSSLNPATRCLTIPKVVKTKRKLVIPGVHADAVAALLALPENGRPGRPDLDAKPGTGRYFFWTGNGKPDSIITSLRDDVLGPVLERAGIVNGHPHRFRDTFAVTLLNKGVPVRTVSKLLGHSSITITEKYYDAWIKGTQEVLEAAMADLSF